jgi:hypothetical protein
MSECSIVDAISAGDGHGDRAAPQEVESTDTEGHRP